MTFIVLILLYVVGGPIFLIADMLGCGILSAIVEIGARHRLKYPNPSAGSLGAWKAASTPRHLSTLEGRIHASELALVALGYEQADAHVEVQEALALLGERATVEDLVRACLKSKI